MYRNDKTRKRTTCLGLSMTALAAVLVFFVLMIGFLLKASANDLNSVDGAPKLLRETAAVASTDDESASKSSSNDVAEPVIRELSDQIVALREELRRSQAAFTCPEPQPAPVCPVCQNCPVCQACQACPVPAAQPACPSCAPATSRRASTRQQRQPAASTEPEPARLSRPPWASTLLSAHGSARNDGGLGLSFTKYNLMANVASAGVDFWYAVQDTLHSAEYIMANEQQNLAYWTAALLRAPTDRPCYVLDIGSNGGFFSLLSRAYGCHVLAVDAQPRCLERLQSSAAVNGFTSGLTTRWAAVSTHSGLTITTGATRCSGLWAVDPALHWINTESDYNRTVTATPLTDLVDGWLPEGAEITIMKADVEGSEVEVWRSALPYLSSRMVRHIMAEVVPARVAPITPWGEVKDTITAMYGAGYTCGEVTGSPWTLNETLTYFVPGKRRAPVGEHWACSLQLAATD